MLSALYWNFLPFLLKYRAPTAMELKKKKTKHFVFITISVLHLVNFPMGEKKKKKGPASIQTEKLNSIF